MTGFVIPARLQDPATAAWIMLRFAPKPLPLAELVMPLGQTPAQPGALQTVSHALAYWQGEGLIEPTDDRTFLMAEHAKALRDPPPAPAKARAPKPYLWTSQRQRIWAAARVLKTFDVVQICMVTEVRRATALAYLGQLTRGGYLKRLNTDADAEPRWTIIRNTGPKSPAIRGRGATLALVDANSEGRFFLNCGVNHVQ